MSFIFIAVISDFRKSRPSDQRKHMLPYRIMNRRVRALAVDLETALKRTDRINLDPMPRRSQSDIKDLGNRFLDGPYSDGGLDFAYLRIQSDRLLLFAHIQGPAFQQPLGHLFHVNPYPPVGGYGHGEPIVV
jgi:hypothetical protein